MLFLFQLSRSSSMTSDTDIQVNEATPSLTEWNSKKAASVNNSDSNNLSCNHSKCEPSKISALQQPYEEDDAGQQSSDNEEVGSGMKFFWRTDNVFGSRNNNNFSANVWQSKKNLRHYILAFSDYFK